MNFTSANKDPFFKVKMFSPNDRPSYKEHLIRQYKYVEGEGERERYRTICSSISENAPTSNEKFEDERLELCRNVQNNMKSQLFQGLGSPTIELGSHMTGLPSAGAMAFPKTDQPELEFQTWIQQNANITSSEAENYYHRLLLNNPRTPASFSDQLAFQPMNTYTIDVHGHMTSQTNATENENGREE